MCLSLLDPCPGVLGPCPGVLGPCLGKPGPCLGVPGLAYMHLAIDSGGYLYLSGFTYDANDHHSRSDPESFPEKLTWCLKV